MNGFHMARTAVLRPDRGHGSFYLVMTALSALLLLAAGCDGGKKEAAYEDLQEWDGRYGSTDRRIEMLKASLYEDPDNFDLLSALGDAYFESQRYEDAIVEYEKALKIRPDDADCLNDMGLAYFYTGNTEKGLESVEKAIESSPGYKHPWLSKGFMLMSIGRYDEAVEPLNRVKELDPGGKLAEEADRFLMQIEAMRGRR